MESVYAPVPETVIYLDRKTNQYGFRVRFPHKKYIHYRMCVFATLEDALGVADNHRERIWEKAEAATDADEAPILISRDFRRGTVGWRMARWYPGVQFPPEALGERAST